jgi:hypothetical protein
MGVKLCRSLRVFENRVPKIIFVSKTDELTGEWRKLHNEKLNDLYSPPNNIRLIKSRIIKLMGHVVCIEEKSGVYRVLLGKPEGKKPLGRPRHR